MFEIHTDGSCLRNPSGPGGCAAVIIGENMTLYTAAFESTTNNRMELMAFILALRHIPEGSKAVIYSDSQYAINVVTGEWCSSANLDLLAEIFRTFGKEKSYLAMGKGTRRKYIQRDMRQGGSECGAAEKQVGGQRLYSANRALKW